VVFAVGHSGLTGEDGETHQGLMDLSMLIPITNMTILTPSDYDEFKSMMEYAVKECKGPVAIRYPKAEVSFRESTSSINPLKAEVVNEGNDILIISVGRMADIALEVSGMLKDSNIFASVVNLRSVKPFDSETLKNAAKGKKLIVTIEDGVVCGGAGQYVAGEMNFTVPVMKFGFDSGFVQHGKQSELFRLCGLDSESIYSQILNQYKGMA